MRYRQPMNTIRFPGKPPAAVRDAMKAYGFRWNRAGQSWQAYQSYESAAVCDYFRHGYEQFTPDGLNQYVGDISAEAACGII